MRLVNNVFYSFDAAFVDYMEITKRHKSGNYQYILYRFRDLHTNEIHYLYDHKNSKNLIKDITNNEHAAFRITGRVTARKMQHFCNIDAIAIIQDDGSMRWIYRI